MTKQKTFTTADICESADDLTFRLCSVLNITPLKDDQDEDESEYSDEAQPIFNKCRDHIESIYESLGYINEIDLPIK